MRYDIEESLEEIEKRRRKLVRRKTERAIRLLATAAVLLVCTLTAVMHELVEFGSAELEESVYGAFLLPRAAGGYILIAVIAFLLGIGVCALIYRRKRMDRDRTEN